MNPDDVILISVDDHIAEPETMFDAHVPAKYKDKAPRVVTDEHARLAERHTGRQETGGGIELALGLPEVREVVTQRD